MYRYLMEDLIAWKSSPCRKPLVLNGARQVGKTWLLKEFGHTQFEKLAYVSLDSNEAARALFDTDFDVQRMIANLSLLTGVRIEPGNTLIVLDEIQTTPKAISALKYFCEDASEYAVAAAGSLLGISAHEGSGFPVGKVDALDLYPMSFSEFLDAMGENMLREMLDAADPASINAFKDRASLALRRYCVVGGMPAAVEEFSACSNYDTVRHIQEQILQDYERDFSKHIPMRLYARVREVWESIPAHLSQENKKFVFGRVREGARAKDFEEALVWLSQAGLVYKVPRVTKPALPLSAYDGHKAFKVFLSDVGLLGAMSGLDPANIVEGNTVFTEFKGALTEQYVCQQLVSECALKPYYWSAENSSGEIDFLVQEREQTFAIEVKAAENLQAKSLRAFKEKHQQVGALRFSLSGYREQNWMRNVPLWAMGTRALWG